MFIHLWTVAVQKTPHNCVVFKIVIDVEFLYSSGPLSYKEVTECQNWWWKWCAEFKDIFGKIERSVYSVKGWLSFANYEAGEMTFYDTARMGYRESRGAENRPRNNDTPQQAVIRFCLAALVSGYSGVVPEMRTVREYLSGVQQMCIHIEIETLG